MPPKESKSGIRVALKFDLLLLDHKGTNAFRLSCSSGGLPETQSHNPNDDKKFIYWKTRTRFNLIKTFIVNFFSQFLTEVNHK